jgi:hypothetical protein
MMASRLLSTALLLHSIAAASVSLPVSLDVKRVVDSGLANIHVSFDQPVKSEVTYTYGPCTARRLGEAHHLVGKAQACDHDRLLWKVPETAPSKYCLSAWDGQVLIGRSAPISIAPSAKTQRRRLKKRQADLSVAMDNSSHIDAEGPWFDGVALLKDKEISAVNVKEAKAKEIAIVGAGMAGLVGNLYPSSSGRASR